MQTSIDLSRPEKRRAELATSLSQLPWWAIIIIATGLLVIYLILSDKNYRATFEFLLAGVTTTLRITLTAFPIATIIGLFVGLARMSKNTAIYTLATLYVEVIRGIPLVVLILMFAFGLVPVGVGLINQIGEWGLTWAKVSPFSNIFNAFVTYNIRTIPMELRAIIALAFGYGAFEAEVFRAGIQSIGRGQMEAARSLGMNYYLAMRLIILPQAIRRILPPLGNDFIALLKDSSLATVLAVNELTQQMRIRRAATFRVMEAFNVGAFLYLSMTLLLSAFVRYLERWLKIAD